MNKIYIRNEQDKIAVTPALRGLIRRAINAALKSESFGGDAEISVTLTDNTGIQELNRDFRHIDRETDVLSFPLFENPVTEGTADEPLPIGDIVLSLEKAVAQADEYGHSTDREIAFLCVHSVLHLLGYDHETGEEDETDMFARQEAVLAKMKLTR